MIQFTNGVPITGGYIPPNPIGNVNIAGQGYNGTNMGGYFGGVYNNYYNPFFARRQAEIAQAQQREFERKQAVFWKKLSKCVNKALNINRSEEEMEAHLKQYDPIDPNDQSSEEAIYNRLLNIYYNGGNSIQNRQNAVLNALTQITKKDKERFPDDIGLAEYMSKAGELAADVINVRIREKQKNVSQLYNSGQFNTLLAMQNNVNGFKTTPNVSIDDMEISLPQSMKVHLAGQRDERRKQFIDMVFKKGGISNG